MIVMCATIVFCIGLYLVCNLSLRGGLHQILRNFEIAHDEYVKIQGEVVVQFWLRPGDEVVQLSFSGGGTADSMPDVVSDL